MKTIDFLINMPSPIGIQNLNNELINLGVTAFTINYETRQISILSPGSVEEREISCALKRAGFKCSCFKICNHKVS